MNISLTRELENFVAKEVKTGLYQSASEVIRAGLRRLKEDQDRKPRFMAFSAAELEAKIGEGLADLKRGDVVSGKQFVAEIKASRAKRRQAHG
jgi:antitoxin ParD1/3/4